MAERWRATCAGMADHPSQLASQQTSRPRTWRAARVTDTLQGQGGCQSRFRTLLRLIALISRLGAQIARLHDCTIARLRCGDPASAHPRGTVLRSDARQWMTARSGGAGALRAQYSINGTRTYSVCSTPPPCSMITSTHIRAV
jgi:hypothetical protein